MNSLALKDQRPRRVRYDGCEVTGCPRTYTEVLSALNPGPGFATEARPGFLQKQSCFWKRPAQLPQGLASAGQVGSAVWAEGAEPTDFWGTWRSFCNTGVIPDVTVGLQRAQGGSAGSQGQRSLGVLTRLLFRFSVMSRGQVPASRGSPWAETRVREAAEAVRAACLLPLPPPTHSGATSSGKPSLTLVV